MSLGPFNYHGLQVYQCLQCGTIYPVTVSHIHDFPTMRSVQDYAALEWLKEQRERAKKEQDWVKEARKKAKKPSVYTGVWFGHWTLPMRELPAPIAFVEMIPLPPWPKWTRRRHTRSNA